MCGVERSDILQLWGLRATVHRLSAQTGSDCYRDVSAVFRRFLREQVVSMNKDQIHGRVKQAEGKVQEATGQLQLEVGNIKQGLKDSKKGA
jgi:uncharacterized protein YjbJ (UPF0337 family)